MEEVRPQDEGGSQGSAETGKGGAPAGKQGQRPSQEKGLGSSRPIVRAAGAGAQPWEPLRRQSRAARLLGHGGPR